MAFTQITDTNLSSNLKTQLAESGAGNVVASINLLQSGSLAINGGTTRWYAPYNLTIKDIKARVIISSLGTDIIVEIKKNGSTVATITIFANSTSANLYTTPISLLYGDYLTVGISQIGVTSRVGSDLYVQFNYKKD
jgi:hypothetical protein